MWRWLLDMGEGDWADLSRWEIAWQGARRWPLLLLGGVMLALLVVHLYREQGRRLSPWRRWLMQGAKVAALLLLLAILLEPVLRAERITPVKSALGVLVDDSLSMGIRDRYLSPEARRLVEGSPAGPLLDQPQSPARMEILKRLLADPDLDPLSALGREFDLKVFRFGEEVEETTPAEIAALEPRSASTDLGSAIRRSLEAFQGRSLSALVLLTDGQHNRGLDPVLAAEAARGQGVRLYAMGFGEPVARDLELTHLLAEDVVFADEEVPLYVKLRQSGFAGTTAEVVLRRGEVEMVRRAVTLGQAPEQTVSLHFTPDLVGTHTYTVELVPQPGELLDTNNQVSKVLRVIDQAIRVLYLEEEPRWFWRFFTAAALRDKRLRLSILLRSADPTLESDPNYVFEFPESRHDMLGYDVVVFGDVNPAYFTDEQLTLLEEFVRSEGGGFLMVAGRRFSPGAWRGTPVETMLPVEFDAQPGLTAEGALSATATYRLLLTPEGRTSSVTRLLEDPEESLAQWDRLAGLYWFAPNITRAKPAASVLATHDSEEARSGPLPLLVAMQYGRGRTMFLGTDETWRWRQTSGDLFRRFWGQAIQYLSVVRLLGEARRVQLTADHSRYSVGDTVQLSARVLDEAYRPLEAERVLAVVRSEGLTESAVELRGSAARPGLFYGSFVASQVGQYFVWVEGAEDSGKAFFTVGPPRREFANPSMNQELLQHLTTSTGGKFYQVDELAGLLTDLQGERREVRHPVEDELWDAPVVLVLITLLLCIEWLVRKRSDLP